MHLLAMLVLNDWVIVRTEVSGKGIYQGEMRSGMVGENRQRYIYYSVRSLLLCSQ